MTNDTVLTGDVDTQANPRDALAARMYPTNAEAAPEAAPNAEVAALRNAVKAQRTLYPDQNQYGDDTLTDLARATSPAGSDRSTGQQKVEWASVARDIGLNGNDLSTLAGYAAAYTQAPPTAEERRANELSTIRQLRMTYGPQFDGVFEDAKALVARDPRFMEYLNRTGLGSHPKVVMRIAELGITARGRGQLPARTAR